MKRLKAFLVLTIMSVLVVATTYNLYPRKKLPEHTVIDSMVLVKSERKLIAYFHGAILNTYNVALGHDPIGHKKREGDGKTPEGTYHISDKTATSRFHKNLGISYPGETDVARAKALGVSPGGDIKIHGLQNGLGFIGRLQTLSDWTSGCVAVTDEEIDELYECVSVGTPVTILP